MALVIYSGGRAAFQVYEQGRDLNLKWRRGLVMGSFGVANNTAASTALSTDGAQTCQIIVVHKAPGQGALGHYQATSNPNEIAQGVHDMIQALGGLPVANVVLAAGEIDHLPAQGESGGQRTQLDYQIEVIAQVRTVCPGADVVWPPAPQGDLWGACYYLPLEELVGLRPNSIGDYLNGGNNVGGISVRDY